MTCQMKGCTNPVTRGFPDSGDECWAVCQRHWYTNWAIRLTVFALGGAVYMAVVLGVTLYGLSQLPYLVPT